MPAGRQQSGNGVVVQLDDGSIQVLLRRHDVHWNGNSSAEGCTITDAQSFGSLLQAHQWTRPALRERESAITSRGNEVHDHRSRHQRRPRTDLKTSLLSRTPARSRRPAQLSQTAGNEGSLCSQPSCFLFTCDLDRNQGGASRSPTTWASSAHCSASYQCISVTESEPRSRPPSGGPCSTPLRSALAAHLTAILMFLVHASRLTWPSWRRARNLLLAAHRT